MHRALSAVLLTIMIFPAAFAQQLDSHPTPVNPADLSPVQAEIHYQDMLPALLKNFRLSRDQTAIDYTSWRRLNQFPFQSATHGRRYINHYANPLASVYGEAGARLPVGAIIAKDAITILDDGRTFPGPLAIMEKMPEGFDPEANDWRFTEILPDGSFLTADNQSGGFCIECHQGAPEGQDLLYFVPPEMRQD